MCGSPKALCLLLTTLHLQNHAKFMDGYKPTIISVANVGLPCSYANNSCEEMIEQ